MRKYSGYETGRSLASISPSSMDSTLQCRWRPWWFIAFTLARQGLIWVIRVDSGTS